MTLHLLAFIVGLYLGGFALVAYALKGFGVSRMNRLILAAMWPRLLIGDGRRFFDSMMMVSGGAGVSEEKMPLGVVAESLDIPLEPCRGCGKRILQENRRLADGCPCNSPRGVNHGLVPEITCTCLGCDPLQTGTSRYALDKDWN